MMLRLGLALLLVAASTHSAQGQWNHWGHNSNGSRYTTASCIRSNNAGLSRKWEFSTSKPVAATPTVCGGKVFFPDDDGNVYALNAADGKVIWRRTMSSYVPEESGNVYSRTSPATNKDCKILVLGTKPTKQPGKTGAYLIGVNADNGNLIWKTKVSGHVNAQITQSPSVYKGYVYVGTASSEENQAGGDRCCVFRGCMLKVSLASGAIQWRTWMAPDNGNNRQGWSGNAIWSSSPAIDGGRNIVVVTTGNNYKYPKSYADCLARTNGNHRQCNVAGNYVDAFVAMNLDTGRVVWANSLNWDYYAWWWPTPTCSGWFGCWANGPDRDFVQGAVLARGKFIAGQKNGDVFALGAADGKQVWRRNVGYQVLWGSATNGRHFFVATTAGNVYALDVDNGNQAWTVKVGGAVNGPLSIANDVLFVPVQNNQVVWLRVSNGQRLGGYTMSAGGFSGPAISGNSVYFGTGYIKYRPGQHKVYALRAKC